VAMVAEARAVTIVPAAMVVGVRAMAAAAPVVMAAATPVATVVGAPVAGTAALAVAPVGEELQRLPKPKPPVSEHKKSAPRGALLHGEARGGLRCAL